jgi:chorismate dehydratase
MQPARCGRISYTNDLPVYAAIDDDVVVMPATLVPDVPAELNRALLEGRLDISPISSAFYADHAGDLLLLHDLCVGAPREVRSIYCISNRPLSALQGLPIAVTRESATARALLQIVCRTWYGFDPLLVDRDDPLDAYVRDGAACLLIGDKAVDASEWAPPASLHDLGTIWRDLSGVGMVFAVWAVRAAYAAASPAATTATAEALTASLRWGLENVPHVIARAQAMRPHREGFYAEYYRALNFEFDDEAQAALSTFYERGRAAGVFADVPRLRFFAPVAAHAGR